MPVAFLQRALSRLYLTISLILGAVILSACAQDVVFAPEADVRAAMYVHNGPPELTLITMINNRTGKGGHTALVVNGSQRVLFDPAGSWFHRTAPQRNDVHFGFNTQLYDMYIRYHARETYHVVIQRLTVTPEVAEMALRAVQQTGPVGPARCARVTSTLLSGLPGFQSIPVGWYPENLMEAFGRLPGVRTEKVFVDAPDNNAAELQRQQQIPVAR